MPNYTVHSDGAYSMKHDIGAYASIIQESGIDRPELAWGRVHKTTSQRMEIAAVIAGLRACLSGGHIQVYSDSEYVVRCAQGQYRRKANLDLWTLFDTEIARLRNTKIEFTSLPRNSVPQLERCDNLAQRATNPASNAPDFVVLGSTDSPQDDDSPEAPAPTANANVAQSAPSALPRTVPSSEEAPVSLAAMAAQAEAESKSLDTGLEDEPEDEPEQPRRRGDDPEVSKTIKERLARSFFKR